MMAGQLSRSDNYPGNGSPGAISVGERPAMSRHLILGSNRSPVRLGRLGDARRIVDRAADPTAGGRQPPLAVLDSFFRMGSLVLGGGQVVLPLLPSEVVPSGSVSNERLVAEYYGSS